jgi:hypothetical protein
MGIIKRKVQEKLPQESYWPKILAHSNKSPFYCHSFVDNFFPMHFFATFSMDSNSPSNSACFDTQIEF